MNPTSMTRKGANDFYKGENCLMIYKVQDGGHEWMKDKCIVEGGTG